MDKSLRSAPPTTTDLRRQNLAAVMRLLHFHGPLRRADITELTDLNKSTVLSLVDELATLGLVGEAKAQPGGVRGRPSAVVSPNSRGVVAVTVEIAVDHARLAVIGLGGVIHQAIDADIHPADAGPRRTAQAIGEASVELLVKRPSVVGVATAVHGLVTQSGRLSLGPNLGWHDLDLIEEVPGWLPRSLPTLFGNDADLGALGEHRRGAGRHVSDLLYLSAERGIGGGLVRQGQLVSGASGFATEVGHFIVRRDGTRCSCGSAGCFETEVGSSALLRKAGRRRNNRRGVAGVLADAESGDENALAAVADVASWLGFGLGSLTNIIDPGLVVLGGYLTDIRRLASDTVHRALDDVALQPNGRQLTLTDAALGADAALVGAAELVFDRVLQDPAALAPRPYQKEIA